MRKLPASLFILFGIFQIKANSHHTKNFDFENQSLTKEDKIIQLQNAIANARASAERHRIRDEDKITRFLKLYEEAAGQPANTPVTPPPPNPNLPIANPPIASSNPNRNLPPPQTINPGVIIIPPATSHSILPVVVANTPPPPLPQNPGVVIVPQAQTQAQAQVLVPPQNPNFPFGIPPLPPMPSMPVQNVPTQTISSSTSQTTQGECPKFQATVNCTVSPCINAKCQVGEKCCENYSTGCNHICFQQTSVISSSLTNSGNSTATKNAWKWP